MSVTQFIQYSFPIFSYSLLFLLPVYAQSPASSAPSSYVTHAVGVKRSNAVPVSTCEQVNVHVRTIVGSAPVSEGGERKRMQLDTRIKDLKHELQKLPFKEYKLLADRSVVVPLLKKKSIKLSGGHRLLLRPLYANNERVGVWIKWKDNKGMQIIDSRLHFNCDEPMLTGMETNEDRGLILAVNVSPES